MSDFNDVFFFDKLIANLTFIQPKEVNANTVINCTI